MSTTTTPTTTTPTTLEANAASLNSADLLGEVVTWDIRTPELEAVKVKAALGAAGLDTDELRDISNSSAFSRACRLLKDNRDIDKVKREGDKVKFQFTRKENTGERVDHDYECMVTLDTTNGDVSCPESPQIEKQAHALINHAINHRTSMDITRLVQKLFSHNADLFPINPRKGVAYFVPEKHRDFTQQVDEFLVSLGGRLERFPVPKGTQQGNSSVREAVDAGLQSLIDELDDSVQGWDNKTRDSTKERAEKRYQEIAYKCEAYTEYLEGRKGSLLAKIEDSKKQLLARVQGIENGEFDDDSSTSAATPTAGQLPVTNTFVDTCTKYPEGCKEDALARIEKAKQDLSDRIRMAENGETNDDSPAPEPEAAEPESVTTTALTTVDDEFSIFDEI